MWRLGRGWRRRGCLTGRVEKGWYEWIELWELWEAGQAIRGDSRVDSFLEAISSKQPQSLRGFLINRRPQENTTESDSGGVLDYLNSARESICSRLRASAPIYRKLVKLFKEQ